MVYHLNRTGKGQLYVYRLEDGSTRRVSTHPNALTGPFKVKQQRVQTRQKNGTKDWLKVLEFATMHFET